MSKGLLHIVQPASSTTELFTMVATEQHIPFVAEIVDLINKSAIARGTGRGKRDPQEIIEKIKKGQSIIAFDDKDNLVGFCYVEAYENGKFFANSALIVSPNYRGLGYSRNIKVAAFELGRSLFPKAIPITITTSAAVMKLNSELGYVPVTFEEITKDPAYWAGCKSCVNYSLLEANNRKHCLCTAMKIQINAKRTHK